jgi:hypothetical protein
MRAVVAKNLEGWDVSAPNATDAKSLRLIVPGTKEIANAHYFQISGVISVPFAAKPDRLSSNIPPSFLGAGLRDARLSMNNLFVDSEENRASDLFEDARFL